MQVEVRDVGLIAASERSPGGGHPLHYSRLENPMDRGAWQAEVHSIAQSLTPERTHVFQVIGEEKAENWKCCFPSTSRTETLQLGLSFLPSKPSLFQRTILRMVPDAITLFQISTESIPDHDTSVPVASSGPKVKHFSHILGTRHVSRRPSLSAREHNSSPVSACPLL